MEYRWPCCPVTFVCNSAKGERWRETPAVGWPWTPLSCPAEAATLQADEDAEEDGGDDVEEADNDEGKGWRHGRALCVRPEFTLIDLDGVFEMLEGSGLHP